MNEDYSFQKALKNLPEKPDTIWQKIVDKYWSARFWLEDTTIGKIWKYRIEYRYLYPIRCWFNPRHKKLRKSIPNEWSDSTELIRIVNFFNS
jgi:hypothetical protein